MNMIDRARFLMFGEIPRKAVARGTENPFARVILAGMGRQAVWTPKRYDTLSEAGYQNCTTVFACVNVIARAAAGVRWKAYDGKNELESHALLDLLDAPNENDGRRAFIAKWFSFLLLAGNSYIIAGRVGSQPPLALWIPRSDRMTVIPGDSGQLVSGYEYTAGAGKQPFEFAQVLHSKLFHPTHDFYGLSPLEVAAHSVDVSNMSSEWNMRLLQNDMRPPGALATDAKLEKDTFDRLNALIKQEWSGYDNAGKPLLLESGLKWINFALTPKEIDWLNGAKMTKRDICSVFNVDPCLVGDSEFATYSNMQEARKGLCVETVLPLMEELTDDLNRWLAPMFGPRIWLEIDRGAIEALQEERGKKFSYIADAWWIKLNEKRKETGFDDLGPAGDIILVPAGMVPLDLVVAGEGSGTPPDGGDGTDTGDGKPNFLDEIGKPKGAAGPLEFKPYPNEHSARLVDPAKFDDFRRTMGGTVRGVKVPATIAVIWGHLIGEDDSTWAPQALRFPTKDWTAEAAKAWLKDKGIKFLSFEPAKEKAGLSPAPQPQVPAAAAQTRQNKASFWTATPERKESLWRSFETRIKVRERTFEEIAKTYLRRQAEMIRARVAKAPDLAAIKPRFILDVKVEAKEYVKKFWPWYKDAFIRAGNAGMHASKGQLFDDAEIKADKPKPTSWVFEMTPEQEETLQELVFNSGTMVNQVTVDIIYQHLKIAQFQNMTVEEFTQALAAKVGDFEVWRARLWARTESTKVDNKGQVEGYRQTEFVKMKGWICSFVPESREDHKDADGQEVALDDAFEVGGEYLDHPGDPGGGRVSASNVCGCLCDTYPVIDEEA